MSSRFSTGDSAIRTLTGAKMPAVRVALVVAHQDDEVIGVGAQLQRWAPHMTVVHATDGAPLDGRDAETAGFDDRGSYARARSAESRQALHLSGIEANQIIELGFTDRSLVHSL